MKMPFLPLKTLLTLTFAGMGFACLVVAKPGLAQPTSGINLQNYESPNSNDPFTQGVEQNPFGLFQLIHNANFGQTNPNFASEQNQQLNDAAAEFKAKQQRLLQQQQGRSGSQVNTPQVSPQSGQ